MHGGPQSETTGKVSLVCCSSLPTRPNAAPAVLAFHSHAHSQDGPSMGLQHLCPAGLWTQFTCTSRLCSLHPICELRAWLHQARIAQGADTTCCSSRPRSFTDMGLGLQIWDAGTRRCLLSMSSHSQAISAVRWGGEGLLYSASRDTVINVWDAQVPLSQSRLQWCCAHQLVLGWAGRCSSLVVGCQGSCVGVAALFGSTVKPSAGLQRSLRQRLGADWEPGTHGPAALT